MYKKTRCPTHPGGILKRHYLEPLNITITEFAGVLKVSRKALSKLVNEKGSLTPDMALRLSNALGTTPEVWLNLQQNFDLWQSANQSKEWREVKKLAA